MNKKQFGLLAGTITALILMGAGCNSSTPNNLDDQEKVEEKNIPTNQDQNSAGTTNDNEEKTENNKGTDDATKTKIIPSTPNASLATTATKETVKEFTITAKDWQFSPSNISVKKGDKVRLTITSADVTHSFKLKDYNLDVMLEPGQTQTVEFVADKAGTFSFRCGVPCGEGHSDMTGTLTVIE